MKELGLILVVITLEACASTKDYQPVNTPDPTAVPEKVNPFAPMTEEEKARYGNR